MPRKNKKIRLKKKIFSKRKNLLRSAAKIHAGCTIFSLLLYVAFGVFLGPEYLARDAADKYKALASTTALTVRLVGPPGKPAVSATPGCSNNIPYVLLGWNATSDTDTYDIYRGGAILMAGVTDTTYNDPNVQNEMTYTYYVIANGPLGNTQSDNTVATTANCSGQITPTCRITALGGRDLTSYSGTPHTTDRTPRFSGTTNIPSAGIEISIPTGPVIAATTTANINGYWTWTVPQKLDYGDQTIYVTARDPLDPTRFAQTSQNFEVEKEEEKETKKKEVAAAVVLPPAEKKPVVSEEKKVLPFALTLTVKNENKIVYTGTDAEISINISKVRYDYENQKNPFVYQILDSEGNILTEFQEVETISEGRILAKLLRLPDSARLAIFQARVIAKIDKDNTYITAEDSFTLKEKPLLKFNQVTISSTQLLNYLGWIWLTLLLFLLLYFILLYIEHRLTLRARLHISEDDLAQGGYVT